MRAKVLQLGRGEKRRLQQRSKKARDPGVRLRALIVLALAADKRTEEIAEVFHYDPSAVRKVRQRYEALGEGSIEDGRAENGRRKVDEDHLEALKVALVQTPEDFGYMRPTWTQEALALALAKLTGLAVHRATISRALKRLGARWSTSRPVVECPWPTRRKRRWLREIERLVERCPADEVVLYEDEIDIHLNPKIGRDWQLPGQQKTVVTPGQNRKHYLAGALNAKTGQIHWASHESKTTHLFLMILGVVFRAYPEAKRIHVILDNYSIHHAKIVYRELAKHADGRIVLHFLPPYCPDHNRIERLWKDLHAQVTRNHRCATLGRLMQNVEAFLERASPWPSRLAEAVS